MQATAKFVMGCWVVVIGFWVVSAFWVKRAKVRQPIPKRFLYLVIIVVAAVLLKRGSGVIWRDHPILPYTLGIAILADVVVSRDC